MNYLFKTSQKKTKLKITQIKVESNGKQKSFDLIKSKSKSMDPLGKTKFRIHL